MDAGLGPTTAAWSQAGPVLGSSYSTGLDHSGLQAAHSAAVTRRSPWGSEGYPSLSGQVSLATHKRCKSRVIPLLKSPYLLIFESAIEAAAQESEASVCIVSLSVTLVAFLGQRWCQVTSSPYLQLPKV